MSNHALRASGFLGPEFNAFLFESIGLDQSGRPLSVVSALARLPKGIAADQLSTLIKKLTECPQAVTDSHKIAVRLVALLPGRTAMAGQNTATPLTSGQAEKLGRSTAIFVLILVLLIGMELLAPHTHQPPRPPIAPPASSATVPAPTAAQR